MVVKKTTTWNYEKMLQQGTMPNVFTLLPGTDEAAGVGEIWQVVCGPVSVTQSTRWGPLFLCLEAVMEGSPAASAAGWAGWRICFGSGRVSAWTSTWTQSPACGWPASSCWTLMDSTRWVRTRIPWTLDYKCGIHSPVVFLCCSLL